MEKTNLHVFKLSDIRHLIEHEYDPACVCDDCVGESLYRIAGMGLEVGDVTDPERGA